MKDAIDSATQVTSIRLQRATLAKLKVAAQRDHRSLTNFLLVGLERAARIEQVPRRSAIALAVTAALIAGMNTPRTKTHSSS